MQQKYFFTILLIIGLLLGPGITYNNYTQFSTDKNRYGKIYDINKDSQVQRINYHTNEIIDTLSLRYYNVFDQGSLYVLVRQPPQINHTIIFKKYYIYKFDFASNLNSITSFTKLSTPFNISSDLQGLAKVGDTFYTTRSYWNQSQKYPTQYLLHFSTTQLLSNRTIPVSKVNKLEFGEIEREFFQIDHNYLYTLERFYSTLNNVFENTFSRVEKYDLTTMKIVSTVNISLPYARLFKIQDNHLWLWYSLLPYQGISYYNSLNQSISSGLYSFNLDDLFGSQNTSILKPQESIFIHDFGPNIPASENYNGTNVELLPFSPIIIKNQVVFGIADLLGSAKFTFSSFWVISPTPRQFSSEFSSFQFALTITGYLLLVYVLVKFYSKNKNDRLSISTE